MICGGFSFIVVNMNLNNKKTVIVAMSGGVDSSVAAKLIAEKHGNVLGIFLHFWKDEQAGEEGKFLGQIENKCCSLEALSDARSVCRKIGIKLYPLNFSEVFKKEIVDNFLREYSIGNTPNPCVRCNKFVKLGLLIKKAKALGYDYVASGHYVRLKKVKDKYKLYRACDKNKDQSYFLYYLNQDQLKHLLFPLGEYKKDAVRQLAKKFDLRTAEKKESFEICFIPGKSHNPFLRRYLKMKSGPIKTLDGVTIGEHQGLPLYTIGQRRGVEIGGTGPYYVVRTDYKTNTLYVTTDRDDKALYKQEFSIHSANWVSGTVPKMPLKCEVVIRYRHKAVKCHLTPSPSPSQERGEYEIELDKAERAVTPGQSAVFYLGDEVIGGGIIN